MVDSTVIHPVWSESSLYALWIAIQTQTFFMQTKARQNVRPAKTQISFSICPVWSESLLCAQWVAIRTQAFSMLTAKTLIRLGRCPGWSESSLGAQAIIVGFVVLRLICQMNSIIESNWFLTFVESLLIWHGLKCTRISSPGSQLSKVSLEGLDGVYWLLINCLIFCWLLIFGVKFYWLLIFLL